MRQSPPYSTTIKRSVNKPISVCSSTPVTGKTSPEDAETLANRIPNLVAWKDGQGDTRAYQRIIDRLGDRFHWVGGIGDDCVPAYYSIGIRTYTSSIATVAPKSRFCCMSMRPVAIPKLSQS